MCFGTKQTINCMNIEVKNVPVRQILSDPNFETIMQACWQECANRSMGAASINPEYYETAEKSGLLHAAAIYSDGVLVGGVTVLVTQFPHFSVRGACIESLFLLPEYRNSRGGLMLLKAAKNMARVAGAPGLYISAPAGSALEKLARAKGLRHTNTVFFEEV